MKRVKHFYFASPIVIIVTLLFIVFSCNETPDKNEIEQNKTSLNALSSESKQLNETEEMVKRLSIINQNKTGKEYLHRNSEKADEMLTVLRNREAIKYDGFWLQYCNQLLFAGKPKECIAELENYFDRSRPLFAQITAENFAVFELLALAHLRKGEQENCQSLHTAYSCILPLQNSAVHQLQEGSSIALKTYQTLYDLKGNMGDRWLINLAYMTLGKYPDEVPKAYLLTFPNWKTETKNFPQFNQVAKSTGLNINGLSGGTCLEDFNNDGLLDVFTTAYGLNEPVKLLQNTGKGDFKDITEEANLKGITSGLNCIHADYNNDGYIDILVLRGAWLDDNGDHPNSLLKNNGNGTFSDVTESSGIFSLFPTQTAAWADVDKDGDLDLFIGNESSQKKNRPCQYFSNNGDGTFTESADKVGLGDIFGFIKGVTFGDINNDGWQELFISDIYGRNLLYLNKHGSFEEIGEQAGVIEPLGSFCSWFWDVNNDGYQDLFVAGYDISKFDAVAESFAKELQGTPSGLSQPKLYINNKDETFSDQTEAYGLSKSMFAMGANFGDLDNDGFLDFYIGTGSPNFTSVVPNRMFRNVKGQYFEEVTSAGGFGHIQKGHGIAFGDIDQDGDEDIYAVMGGAFEGDVFTNILYENPGFKKNWIVIDLKGVTTNRNGIGSRIIITLDNNQKIYRTVGTGGSFGSSSLQQEVGLNRSSKVKELTIEWQNGTVQHFKNINVNQKISITEGQEEFEIVSYSYIPFKTS